jgi:hypothetical protein
MLDRSVAFLRKRAASENRHLLELRSLHRDVAGLATDTIRQRTRGRRQTGTTAELRGVLPERAELPETWVPVPAL